MWEVSTGHPIVPDPGIVRVDRLLCESIDMLGYAAETSIGEAGVTKMERMTSGVEGPLTVAFSERALGRRVRVRNPGWSISPNRDRTVFGRVHPGA